MCKIRLLEASDIEVRAQQVTEKGAVLLLYKNARVDMAILDEIFGVFGWQREHFFKEGKNYCRVSIWDKEKQAWIAKEDVGVKSNTEEEKGEASDAFKRACVNIGIGRELYTAPFIWVPVDNSEITSDTRGKVKLKVGVSFSVKDIEYNDKRCISRLVIVDNKGRERYRYPRMNATDHVAAPATPAPTVPDPLTNAQPAEQKPKRRIGYDFARKDEQYLDPETINLANVIIGDQLLKWAYGKLGAAGTADQAAELLARCYAPQETAVATFKELYESYKMGKQ